MVGPAQPDADGVDRPPDTRTVELVVDDQLVHRVRSQPVGRGPVGRHVARPPPGRGPLVGGARPARPAPRLDGASSSAGSTKSTTRTYAVPQPVSRRGVTVRSDARRVELRRHVGVGGGPLPGRPRPGPGRPALHVGRVRPCAPTASRPRCWPRARPHQDKVAHYLYNAPSTWSRCSASTRPALVPVNTNYRYADDELVYLWSNADAVAVVFHGDVRRTGRADPSTACRRCARGCASTSERRALSRAGRRRTRRPRARRTSAHRGAVGAQRRRPLPPLHRRHDRHAQGRDVAPGRHRRQPGRASRRPLPARARRRRALAERVAKPGPMACPAAPLMHGTGAFNAM